MTKIFLKIQRERFPWVNFVKGRLKINSIKITKVIQNYQKIILLYICSKKNNKKRFSGIIRKNLGERTKIKHRGGSNGGDRTNEARDNKKAQW